MRVAAKHLDVIGERMLPTQVYRTTTCACLQYVWLVADEETCLKALLIYIVVNVSSFCLLPFHLSQSPKSG